MTSPSQRLAALGLALPPVVPPLAAYRPAVRVGATIVTSGQLPMRDGSLLAVGAVGEGPDDVAPERARDAAQQCALNALAAVAGVAGGLDSVRGVVKVVGYVASVPGFYGQPSVLDGASTLLGEVFGEQGHHARSAVGVAALPLGASVEVELVALGD